MRNSWQLEGTLASRSVGRYSLIYLRLVYFTYVYRCAISVDGQLLDKKIVNS